MRRCACSARLGRRCGRRSSCSGASAPRRMRGRRSRSAWAWGLDAGEAVPTQGGYRGASLNLAARLCALAKPGEILASETVIGLASRVDGMRFLEGRSAPLKGMTRPVRYVVVEPEQPLPSLPPQPGAKSPRRRRQLIAGACLAVLAALAIGVAVTRRGGTSPGLPGDAVAVVASNGRASAPVDVGAGASGVATSGSVAWIANYLTDQVLKVDTSTGSTIPAAVGAGPAAVAVGDGAVWVANAGDGTVSEVSPTAVKSVVSPIYVGNGPSGIVAARHAVWVTLSLDGAVAEIDPNQGKVVATFSAGTDPTRITYGFGMLWVTNESVGTVTPIDPTTNEAQTPIPLGGGPNALAIGAGGVFVTNSLDGTVSRIDPQTKHLAWAAQAGSDPEGVAVVGDSVWVASHGSGEISRFDAHTGAPQSPLAVGSAPLGLAALGAGAAVTTTSGPGRHRGGTLTIASGPLAQSIDPQSFLSSQAQPWQTFSMTNDGLVGFKRVPGPDGETVVANLATSLPAPTDNGHAYIFQLRRGIHYSTGQPVEASDIRYGIERAFTVNVGKQHDLNLGQQFYDDIVGASTCATHLATCRLNHGIVVNDQAGTVTFHLRRADPNFLAKLAMPMAVAVPPQVPPDDQGTRPLPATGPYMIANYDPKKGAILVETHTSGSGRKTPNPMAIPTASCGASTRQETKQRWQSNTEMPTFWQTRLAPNGSDRSPRPTQPRLTLAPHSPPTTSSLPGLRDSNTISPPEKPLPTPWIETRSSTCSAAHSQHIQPVSCSHPTSRDTGRTAHTQPAPNTPTGRHPTSPLLTFWPGAPRASARRSG